MKKILFVVATLILVAPAAAKDYSIPELRIEVDLNRDGTLQITEHRTYVYNGSYSWANYELPKSGYSHIEDICVSEGDFSFINKNSDEPGTFLVEESGDSYNIKWFYEAEDEERVFTISYTLRGAVTTGPEWSEFFWTYAASGREKSTERFSAKITLPEPVAENDLHFWVRDPQSLAESRITENGFEFYGSDISRRQAITLRTVFPTRLFNSESVSISDPDFSLAWAEMDEEAYHEEKRQQEEREAYLEKTGIRAGVILVVLSITAFFFFYRKYGVRHKSRVSYRESLMIPGDIPPAVAAWLLDGRNTTGNHMFATLLDLARRKYFTITEKPGKEKMFSESKPQFFVASTGKEPENNLPEWELSILNFVRQQIREGYETPEEIFKYEASSVSKWYNKWKRELRAYCQEKGWIDSNSYGGFYRNAAVQLFLVSAAIAGMFFIHKVLFIALLFCTGAAVCSFAIIRRTPEGEEMYRRWKAYRQALLKAKDYQVQDNHLGHHFIYSVAFGVGKKRIEKLFQDNPDAVPLIYWIAILPQSRQTPAEMASSFSTLSATGTSSFGGGAAAGGASAGAAGGGASGGAG